MSELNLRSILPNTVDSTPGDSSTSNSKNKKVTPDTMESTPSVSSMTADIRAAEPAHITKKRKVPASITTNACVNCKKARAKCDGETPCGRCTSKNRHQEDCLYEPHTKNSKTKLVEDLKESHAIKHMAETIFECLANNTKYEREILKRIKNRDTITSIGHWIESKDSGGESQPSTFGGTDNEFEGDSPRSDCWTTVTLEKEVIRHLMTLYFTWVHPFHPLFNEGHFVKSMLSGTETFCSRILFQAICAMACHLHTEVENDDVNYRKMGVQFCDAVRSKLNPDEKLLTTIQAFMVMFLVRCAQGQGLSGSVYLTTASRSMENMRPSDSDNSDYRQIWRETLRGINSLNVEWAQMTFKVPPTFIPELQPTQFANEANRLKDEADRLSWKPYRFPEDFTGEPTWNCLTATTNREKLKLIEIIRDATTLLYNASGPQIHAKDVLGIYRRLLTWHDDLPDKIANTGRKDVQMLPHVLSLHILYATTAVQLLRPLLNLGETLVDPLVWQHAQDGLSLINDRYRFQYSCRYQPVSQIFALLHLTEVLIRSFPEIDKELGKDGVASTKLATDILRESRSSFPVAGVFLTMLQKTTKKLLDPLPQELDDLFHRPHRKSEFLLDDAINACASSTYIQPVEAIQKRFSPDLASEWKLDADAFGFPSIPHGTSMARQLSQEERGARDLMRILNLSNTQ